MKTLTRLQTLDAVRNPGHGNHAFRRMLSLFREVTPNSFDVRPETGFVTRWKWMLNHSRGTAESIGYRLSKLANRPLDRICPPSWQVCNNWIYERDCLKRSQRSA